jgi:transposase
MALERQRDRQSELLVAWSEMPRSPGHVFYDRLQAELVSAGFDGFVENRCATHYAARRGRPSLPPGRYFRMPLIAYFEGIDSDARPGMGGLTAVLLLAVEDQTAVLVVSIQANPLG